MFLAGLRHDLRWPLRPPSTPPKNANTTQTCTPVCSKRNSLQKFPLTWGALIGSCHKEAYDLDRRGVADENNLCGTDLPPVALDDRGLESLLPQLGHLKLHLAGLRLQLALVMASARVAARFAAFVTLRIAQPVGLGVEQCVQCLLHRAPEHPVQVTFDPLVIDRDDIAQRTRCTLRHGGSLLLHWLRFATSSSARFGAASPT